MDKKTYINELQEGDFVDDLFLVQSAKVSKTRAGKPYLILSVKDKSGEISGPVWEGVEQVRKVCEVGSFINLSGSVQSYRDKLQLKIDQVRPVATDDVDQASFVVTCDGNRDEMAQEILSIIHSIENSYIKKLLTILFKQKDLWSLFQEAPAAKVMHHGYLGGLMEHCLSMAKVSDLVASHYNGVDRSLLIAGALLHDIGKIQELAMDVGLVEYTDVGRLKGHLVMGSELVADIASRIEDFPQELLHQLQHLILSHHGQLQFGSPTLPMTVEALLLSQIDDMDAKMNMLERLRLSMKEPGYQWSEYQRSLERYLYLRPLAKSDKDDELTVNPGEAKQQSLF